MVDQKNSNEVAREALRLLSLRRMAPTPENYAFLYHEVEGTADALSLNVSPLALDALTVSLPFSPADKNRYRTALDDAAHKKDWKAYQTTLLLYVQHLAEVQKLAWGQLLESLLTQWETRHVGLTQARKREMLTRVLTSNKNNVELLHQRLLGLVRSWQQSSIAVVKEDALSSEDDAVIGNALTPERPFTLDTGVFQEIRHLFAFTLEKVLLPLLSVHPDLVSLTQEIASDVREGNSVGHLQNTLVKLKRLAFRLELFAEDQILLRETLFKILRLLVDNIAELLLDDLWMHGQIDVVRNIVTKPLSQRLLNEAERRLKEVLFKQSQLKASLMEARSAITSMLAGFVDQLAGFAETTSDYHDKISGYASQISSTRDIHALEDILSKVMRETRQVQHSTQAVRDELRLAKAKVQAAEEKIQALECALEETSACITHDPLTGVLNRRGLDEVLANEMARAARYHQPLCTGLLDIDNFKRLNDTYGHDAGDEALLHLAQICRDTLRPQDSVARYGGEEFVIVLPGAKLSEAKQVLLRLQRELTKRIFMRDKEKLLITFSAGVTDMREGDSEESMIKRADEAMYMAKKAGKNKVLSAGETM